VAWREDESLSASARRRLSDKRLGLYVDFVYREIAAGEARRISTDRAVILFMTAVAESFGELVIFGRTVEASEDADYVLPPETRLVALPHYENLRRLPEVARAGGATISRMWDGLSEVDVAWVFGPHPFAAVMAVFAVLRRKQLVLGVRQHSVKLYATRLHGRKKVAGVAAMWLLDGVFRLLVRGGRARIMVQGAELAERYDADRANVLTTTVSAIREQHVVGAPPDRDWSGVVELLTVGRLEPEKNPFLFLDVVARLEGERPGRFRLTWVGRGPLEEAVKGEARRRGIEDRIVFAGYVPFDGGLLDLYRRADAFVHVSLSEGMPMVLIEALAAGIPVVATDVGGVRAAMADGATALLVPPADAEGLVQAIIRLSDDAELRRGLAVRGLERARQMTLEAEADRAARFIAAGVRDDGG
jgi:glycosyltransferase involved in cell wall biosynthesis